MEGPPPNSGACRVLNRGWIGNWISHVSDYRAGEARVSKASANTEGRLLSRPSRCGKLDYFFGAIASLVALAMRNFTTVLALIWMGSPVCGLRPMRALR